MTSRNIILSTPVEETSRAKKGEGRRGSEVKGQVQASLPPAGLDFRMRGSSYKTHCINLHYCHVICNDIVYLFSQSFNWRALILKNDHMLTQSKWPFHLYVWTNNSPGNTWGDKIIIIMIMVKVWSLSHPHAKVSLGGETLNFKFLLVAALLPLVCELETL